MYHRPPRPKKSLRLIGDWRAPIIQTCNRQTCKRGLMSACRRSTPLTRCLATQSRRLTTMPCCFHLPHRVCQLTHRCLNITAYNFRLTDRAARRIINILLVASVVLFVVSQLPTSAQSETYGQAPVLQVLMLYMLFRLRDSNALKDRIPLILGAFVFVGGLFMAATATAITQATSAGQNKFSIEVVIWVITCLWACTILIRHFKVEPP